MGRGSLLCNQMKWCISTVFNIKQNHSSEVCITSLSELMDTSFSQVYGFCIKCTTWKQSETHLVCIVQMLLIFIDFYDFFFEQNKQKTTLVTTFSRASFMLFVIKMLNSWQN